jgi:hypothetical protein
MSSVMSSGFRARVRVLHDGGHGRASEGTRERLATFLVQLLDEGRPFPDRHGHADTSSSIGRV